MTERTTDPAAAPATEPAPSTLLCCRLLVDAAGSRAGERLLLLAADARRLAAAGLVAMLDDEHG